MRPKPLLTGHDLIRLGAVLGPALGQLVDAARYFEQFRQNSSPEDGALREVMYDLGRAYEAMGEKAIAIEVYEEFLKKHPQDCRVKAQIEELKEGNRE